MADKIKDTGARGGSLSWFLQRISAVILFILLMAHYITYHFISKGAVTYSQVIAKMSSPWFNLTQFLFLICGLYHGLNGVWNIIEDYIHNKNWRLILFGIILTAGLSLLFIGTMTIFKITREIQI